MGHNKDISNIVEIPDAIQSSIIRSLPTYFQADTSRVMIMAKQAHCLSPRMVTCRRKGSF